MDSKRDRYMGEWERLKNERSTWVDHWRDIAKHVAPRKFRYLSSDRNNGRKQNQAIINNTATRALRSLAAGIMTSETPPSRPWFKLTLANQDLSEFGAVRAWLDQVERIVLDTFSRSNLYTSLHNVYVYLGGWGTAAMHVDDDARDGIRAYVFPIGQYALANSAREQVDTVYREFSMTVSQLAQEFGIDSCTPRVQGLYKNKKYQDWVDVLHVVEPNREAMPGQYGQSQMPYRSCWYEKSADPNYDKPLRESGYYEFPIMAPRWVVTGEDVYGESPGMDALGDIRALQHLERRKGQALDLIVTPPYQIPAALEAQRPSMVPGTNIYVDSNMPGQMIKPAIELDSRALPATEGSAREHEQRIDDTFYSSLWLALTNNEMPNMTAREVAERHEEKMIQLGPVAERLEVELLNPLISRTLSILGRNGKFPPLPPEMHGQIMDVEYTSIMAQAQKLVATSSIERLTSFVGSIAGVKSDVLDKYDFDAAVEEMADGLGAPSRLIIPQEKVNASRMARAKEQQQMADIQKAQALAQGAATLSQADVTSDNGLTRVAGALPALAQAGVTEGLQ